MFRRKQLLVYPLIIIVIAAALLATNLKSLRITPNYERSDSAIQVMNADGSGQKRLTAYGDVDSAAWSPDGRQIAFLLNPGGDRAGNNLHVMNADGAQKITLTDNISGSVEGFDWAPDSRQIVFTNRVIDDSQPHNRGSQSTYRINVDGTNLKQLMDDREIHLLKWSPDGSRIVIRSGNDGRHELYTMNPDGSNVTQLTDFSAYSSNVIPIVYWSPDGRKIAFNVIDGVDELFIMNSDGSRPVEIVPNDGHRGIIGWTPDSGKILFFQQDSGARDIHIVDIDGSNEINLTANSDDSIGEPMLSPDGRRLLFSSGRFDDSDNEIPNYDIFVTNIDGSALTQLTHHQRNHYTNESAIWSPDGSLIIFFTIRYSRLDW
jgi:Tol biopolymer transport system component